MADVDRRIRPRFHPILIALPFLRPVGIVFLYPSSKRAKQQGGRGAGEFLRFGRVALSPVEGVFRRLVLASIVLGAQQAGGRRTLVRSATAGKST